MTVPIEGRLAPGFERRSSILAPYRPHVRGEQIGTLVCAFHHDSLRRAAGPSPSERDLFLLVVRQVTVPPQQGAVVTDCA